MATTNLDDISNFFKDNYFKEQSDLKDHYDSLSRGPLKVYSGLRDK